MAHGTPDWGQTAGAVTVYQLSDMAELAARLGSPITHDRRGDVMWWDDFEWSLNKWQATVSGTGAAAAISTARARNGRCSVLLTAGSDGGFLSEIAHLLPFPALSNLGAEFSFSLGSVISDLTLEQTIRDGAASVAYGVRWNDVTNMLQYFSSAGAWTDLAATPQYSSGPSLFHVMKVVVDAVARKYVRLIVDDVAISMAGLGAEVSVSAFAPLWTVEITNNGRAGSNDTVYIDDVILTQNEPV